MPSAPRQPSPNRHGGFAPRTCPALTRGDALAYNDGSSHASCALGGLTVRLTLRPALLSLALILTSAVPGLCAGVEWDVEIGFDGAFTSGAWTPVFVSVHNDGDSRSGRITIPVSLGQYSSGFSPYTAPVEVPKGSEKLYRLYLPAAGYDQTISLELGGQVASRQVQDARPVDPENLLTVVLSSNASALSFLQGARAPVSAGTPSGAGGYPVPPPPPGGGATPARAPQVELARSQWGRLPESWLGWDGVDAVILTEADLGGASQQEIEALRQWVLLGGTLLVPGGTQSAAFGSGPLAELLPMQVSGTRTVANLSALDPWGGQAIGRSAALIADGTLRDGAEVLLGNPQTPLVVARDADRGRVVMTTFDFTAEPVKYWDGQTEMWQRLLAAGAAHPPDSGFLAAAGALRDGPWSARAGLSATAARGTTGQMPPIWMMIGFLLAYVIVVVPVNYLIVSRLGRRELAWLTTPAIIIVFFAGAWAMGLSMRGNQTVVSRLAAIELQPGQAMARALGFVGVFSPAKIKYDLALEGTAAAAVEADVTGAEGFTMVYGPTPRVADLSVNMWSTRVVQIEFLADLGGGIDGYLEYDGTNLTAHVRNRTGISLDRVGIVREGRIGDTTVLEPGQEADLGFIRTTELGVGPGGRRERTLADAALADLFAPDAGPGGMGMGMPAPVLREHPHVIAVCDEPLVPVKLVDRPARTEDAAVMLIDLPVRLSTGSGLTVPDWMVESRIISTDGNVQTTESYPGYAESMLYIEQGSATFELTVPLGPGGGKVTGLKVLVISDVSMYGGGSGAPAVFVRNLATGQWDKLTLTGSTAPVPNAGQCVTPDGRVQVKVEAKSGGTMIQSVGIEATVDSF